MKSLASRPQQMKRSGIREILEIAVRTPGCIRLEVGEPNFPTPPHIVEAAHRAAQAGKTRYTLSTGILPLREALVEKVRKFNGLSDVQMENVIVTPGSTYGLFNIFEVLLEAGDEVLVPDPGWPTYGAQVTLVGGTTVRYPLYAANNFQPVISDIEPLITPRTKVILLCNPSNPTGAVATAEQVKALVELAQKHDLYVISDEVYEELIFEGSPVTTAQFDRERVISVYSFSKTYSMTGWRVGYTVAPANLATLMGRVCEPNLPCPAEPNQWAALEALTGPQDVVREMALAYKHRRDLVCDVLRQQGMLQYVPSGAFYIMVDISKANMDSYDFCKALLQEKKVACAPGATFGPSAAGMVRVSLATAEDELVEGVNRLCAFVEEQAAKGTATASTR
ncbi:MAG TPA: pyridoxal phosphate-dependent aminotransferase [Chloroflexia bacterium]|nr:pyridoxal phosphate-dependent aminotransferase [Chloroflexia bacterium]